MSVCVCSVGSSGGGRVRSVSFLDVESSRGRKGERLVVLAEVGPRIARERASGDFSIQFLNR